MIDERKFVEGGAKIPNKLLQSHGEGRLILFCGAGISYKLQKRGFKGLTEDLYKNLNAYELLENEGRKEKREFDKGNYDRVLQFLEDQNMESFRNELEKWGTIKSKNADFSTHEAIIDLSTTKNKNKDEVRLVTTNFDLGFSELVKKKKKYKKIDIDSPPKFPVAKKQKWNNSIVHLHGIATEKENIVVTSADFGSAYITERWANKFITDLFYNFDILFIGYSLEDPVLRYLTDAIASDMENKFDRKRYAFVKKSDKDSWDGKKIIPIEFNDDDDFYALHSTLKKWAEEYEEGNLGFKKLCSSLYNKPPLIIEDPDPDTENNTFNLFINPTPIIKDSDTEIEDPDPDTERIVYELFNNPDEKTPLFVNIETENKGKYEYPHLDWWIYLSKRETEYLSAKKEKNEVAENFLNALVHQGNETPPPIKKSFRHFYMSWFIDDLMKYDEIKKWVINRGGCLHPDLIERILNTYDETFDSSSEKDKKFWDYLIFNREILAPSDFFKTNKIYLNEKFPLNSQKIIFLTKVYAKLNYSDWYYNQDKEKSGSFLKYLYAYYKLNFTPHDNLIHKYISSCTNKDELNNIFFHLKSELQKVINNEYHLENIPEDYDYGSFSVQRPSISPHRQNNERFNEWTYIIGYLVVCFEKLAKVSTLDARYQVISYLNSNTPFYKRLSLHFLTYKEIFSSKEVQEYLEKDLDIFLWLDAYRREKFRLLDARWDHFPEQFQNLIITKILNGRPRLRYRKDLSPEEIKEIKEYDKGALLSWFSKKGFLKNEKAKEILTNIKKKHPDFDFYENAKDDRAEFSNWMGEISMRPSIGTGPPKEIFEEKDPKKIVDILMQEIQLRKNRIDKGDIHVIQNIDFSNCLSSDNSKNILKAFDIIIVKNHKDDEINFLIGNFFSTAIHNDKSTSPEKLIPPQNYKKLISLIKKCPDNVIEKCLHGITACYMDIITKKKQASLSDEWDIWERLYSFASVEKTANFENDYDHGSINTPLGHLYFILFQNYFFQPRKWDCGLDEFIKKAWEKLKKIGGDQKYLAYAHYGREMNNISIVDYKWFKENMYPVLSSKDDISKVLWNCYFDYPRYNLRLIKLIKSELLDLSNNLKKIKNIKNYSDLILNIGLYYQEHLSPKEFRKVLSKLDIEQRSSVVGQISHNLLNTEDDKKDIFWEKKIKPWIKKYWPTSNDYKNEKFNSSWIGCILKIPNPKEVDFELINELLYPNSNALIELYRDKKKNHDLQPEYLSLILTLIKGKIEHHNASEVKTLLEDMSKKHRSIKKRNDYKEICKILKKKAIDI